MTKITLKAARVNKGLNQSDVALHLAVNVRTVGNWESGKTMPKLDKIEPLCEMLGVKYDDIKWKV